MPNEAGAQKQAGLIKACANAWKCFAGVSGDWLEKRCHGCDPKAAARPHPSSAARCLFSPMGVSDDSAPTEHFFIALSRKRVARIMRQQSLGIQPKRRFVRTTDSQHDGPICPNLYRNRMPDQPDRIRWRISQYPY